MRRLLLVVVLAAVAFGLWYHETRWPLRRDADEPLLLEVEPGMSAVDIGRRLQELGLVRHAEVFRALVLEKRAQGRLRAGEYEIRGGTSLEDIVGKLVRGDVVRRTATFREGADLDEMARIAAAAGIDADAFLEAAADPEPIRDLDPEAEDLEGYLYPDTYEITRRRDAAAVLVRRMVRRFREVMEPRLPALAARGLSLREAVVLASLVEKETARAEERARIAAVFLNRLERRMPLQTDPTVIFALKKAGRYDGNIRKADLSIDSPYNTYRHAGLPPGPIASPGHEALEAVLAPAPVEDLYFVSRNDGSHYFSRTLAEHQRAVDYYQRRRGARPPRDRSGPGS